MAKFSLMDKTLNLEQIEGKYSAFAKVPYAIVARMSKKIAKDGYGKVTVDGIEISQGAPFEIDIIVKLHCLLIPVGEVAREYDKEYTVTFSDFVAEDGSKFQTQSFKFRTLPRRKRDEKYALHDEVALQAAVEGMVLLKNENNVLPLQSNSVLNCFGRAQFMYRNTATGAGLINPRWQADLHQAVKEHSNFSVNDAVSSLYNRLKDVTPTADTLKVARSKSDVALIFISRTSGEFLDNKPIKGGYYLTDDEERMIAAVAENFDKTVAIINTGYPIDMRWVKKYDIKAVLYTGFAGMMSGYALAELLDGRANPSGKLPDTWSWDYYDNPASKNFINFNENDAVPGEKDKGVHIYYEEDIYVGYRYFDTFNKDVAFSFGYGLSYTSFDTKINDFKADRNGIVAEIAVTNTGKRSGKEVMQMYVSAPDGNIEKPRRVLTAFDKTDILAPNATQSLRLTADRLTFASFDEERCAYVLDKGEYVVYVGNSLATAQKVGSFNVSEMEVLKQVARINPPLEQFHKLTKKQPFVKEDSKLVDLKDRISVAAKREEFNPPLLKKNKKVKFEQLKNNPELLDDFVARLSVKELCKLNVCGGADWYMPWGDGSAGKTRTFKGLPKIKVADGNTGVNIKKPNIGFPSSCTIAATFNKQLAYEIGKTIGNESKENGILINLGPAMNIHRNILNGRHPEYFSEDPYLSGIMAGHHAKGLEQSGVRSTYKHLFCNNSDTSRKGSHSIVSERALREIYFRTFEFANSVQMPSCVMTSYNAVNGIYPAENAEVLQNLVRGEWGFDGMIMTDWGTYDTVDAVEMVKAGNCWLTEGSGKYVKKLYKAAKSGELSVSVLQDNAKYIIKTILKCL